MSGFSDDLKKCLEFFKPENLEKQDLTLDDVALVVIDVQKEFCDPKSGPRGNEETKEISERISSIVPEFRKAGIPVYVVYYCDEEENKTPEEIDFYKFQPAKGDTLIAKSTNSAFDSSALGDILRHDHRTTLLTCGFNFSACLRQTAEDAMEEGFNVVIMRDLTGNDNYCPDVELWTEHDLEHDGAEITSSRKVLKKIRKAAAPG